MGGIAFSSTGVVALGVSTRFVYWAFGIVQNVVEAISGPTLSLPISSLQQLREGFARRDGAGVVVTADFPDADLAEFVCASGLPPIVVTDDVGSEDWLAQRTFEHLVETAKIPRQRGDLIKRDRGRVPAALGARAAGGAGATRRA